MTGRRPSGALPPIVTALAGVTALAASAAVAISTLACSPPGGGGPTAAAAADATATPTAASGPRVVFPSGRAVSVELAVNDADRSQGLMYRASMPKDHGMIFLFDGEEVRPFWMKNCHFPLDLIYTHKDGTVVDVLRDVPPCKADPCPNYPPKASSDTVVEVNAGVAPANGVVPGAKLRYVEVPGR